MLENLPTDIFLQDRMDTSQTLKKLTQDQLDAMVKLHQRYLDGRIGGRRASLKNTDLSGLVMRSCNLSQSDFMSCIMMNMDLSGSNFSEASLYACDLSVSNLNNASFTRADLRGAKIENASMREIDLEKADLRSGGVAVGTFDASASKPVNFCGANLTGAKMKGVLASKANFEDSILVGADMSGVDLTGAKLTGADLSNAETSGAQFDGADLEDAILLGVELDDFKRWGLDVSSALTDENAGTDVSELEEPLPQMLERHRDWVKTGGKSGRQMDLSDIDMRFLKTLKQEKLIAIKAIKAKFCSMNLYKTELQSAVMDKSDFRYCDMEEADMRGASFKGANFSHAKLCSINANALMFGVSSGQDAKRFSPCDFEGAKFRYADLKGGQFKNANFKGADLSHADFTGCDLREADFTGAIMVNTNTEGANLEGAIIDSGKTRIFKIPQS